MRWSIDLDALPLADGVAEVARQLGADRRAFAATGGEDFELCACLPAGVARAGSGSQRAASRSVEGGPVRAVRAAPASYAPPV